MALGCENAMVMSLVSVITNFHKVVHADVQFFTKLTDQGLITGFTRLDSASGQAPAFAVRKHPRLVHNEKILIVPGENTASCFDLFFLRHGRRSEFSVH